MHALILQSYIRSQHAQHARQADGREVVDHETQRLVTVRQLSTPLCGRRLFTGRGLDHGREDVGPQLSLERGHHAALLQFALDGLVELLLHGLVLLLVDVHALGRRGGGLVDARGHPLVDWWALWGRAAPVMRRERLPRATQRTYEWR